MGNGTGRATRTKLNLEAGAARVGDPVRIYEQSGCPPLYREAFMRAWSGKASPLGAIKAMCLHCMGGARLDVASCTSESCPLWCYRPYRGNVQNDGV